MEFIKVGKKWLIKASNGKLISDEEKKELENKELILEEEHCKSCEIKIPKKKSKKKKTVTSKKEITDDIIKETNISI